MGTTYVYRLTPLSAFHFGERGVGVEQSTGFGPADTLFSALCLTLRAWEPDGNQRLQDWLAGFPPLNGGGPPPFRLSSAFPYAGEVLFFPKPMILANLPAETRQAQAKKLKKVALVSLEILRRWLAQEDLNADVQDGQFLHGGKVWVAAAELDKLRAFLDTGTGRIKMWATDPLPRVAVDRETSRSSVYQAGAVRFRSGAGLYTLAEFLNGDAREEQKRLTTLLQVMGDGGLGGERSSGYGHFRLQGPEPFAGWGGAPGGLFVTLAPYHPTPTEVEAGVLDDDGAAYTLLTRRGWVGSPDGSNLRRRLVRLLGEGSVLHHTGAPGYGDLADVTPLDDKKQKMLPHTVWRYGIAFPVPAARPVVRKEGDRG